MSRVVIGGREFQRFTNPVPIVETKDPVQLRAKLARLEKAGRRALDAIETASREMFDAVPIVAAEPTRGIGFLEGDLVSAQGAAEAAHHLLASLLTDIETERGKLPRKPGGSR